MCLCPIKIKNANRRTGWFYNQVKNDFCHHARLFDVTSEYIYVPCGHCPECVRSRQNDIIQRTNLESLESHLYFCTLTYNDEHLPILDNPFRDGQSFAYADITHIQLLMKRLRNHGLKFRYLATSERGTKRGRPHFHIIFFFPKSIYKEPYKLERELFYLVLNNWAVNVGTRKFPKYVPLCSYKVSRSGKRNYDLHYCVPNPNNGYDDISFYVSKYIFKFSDSDVKLKQLLWNSYSDFIQSNNVNESELPCNYLDVWKKIKCRRLSSLSFGLGFFDKDSDDMYNGVKTTPLIYNKCRNFIQRSIDSFTEDNQMFKFYHEDGKSFPLSSYIRKKFLNTSDLWAQYYASNSPYFDKFQTSDKFFDKSIYEIKEEYRIFDASLNLLKKRDSIFNYDNELFIDDF